MTMPAASPQPAPPLYKSSGSQKRQRQHTVQVVLSDEEFADVAQKAQACGLSLSSFGRASMLGTPGPRAQRAPHVNAVELAKATAALNKVGSLLNQMAHVLNAGGSIVAHECFAALAETRAALARILEIVGRKNRE
jgi:Mobilization protein NikA